MDEQTLKLLVALHEDGARQGPGSEEETRRALALAGLAGRRGLEIADVGCGTGASTLALAQALDARVHAVDLHPAFLARLEQRAAAAGVAARIVTHAASMEALPFAPGTLDAIWSEGAIYNLGFERGVALWRPLLKPGGVLAVSELTWFTASRPEALDAHWREQYAEVDLASAKLDALERSGYAPLGYFALSARCWLDAYYRPLQARFASFLSAHGHSEAAQQIVAQEQAEIALYEAHQAHFGYGFYIARRDG